MVTLGGKAQGKEVMELSSREATAREGVGGGACGRVENGAGAGRGGFFCGV